MNPHMVINEVFVANQILNLYVELETNRMNGSR